MILEIEPVPELNWHISLANLLPKPVWDKLRREVYTKFNYTCCICGRTDTRVNCHEKWLYDDMKKIQKLQGFQCLCDDCHNIKHWGRTVALAHKGELSINYLSLLTNHFCKINGCSISQFMEHKVVVGNLHQKRSKKRYKVDFGEFHPDRVIEIYSKLVK